MATQRSATVQITNNSGGNAQIQLWHSNSSNGTQSASWTAAPGETVGSLTVLFETGFGTGTILDYWSVLMHVQDGPAPGYYASSGSSTDPYWKECQLQHEDADQTLTFSVSTTELNIALDSGGCPNPMTKLAPYSPITHVFVVMLENHSFDNIFAMSGIPGITAATTSNSNTYNGNTYYVQSGAPLSMPTDPGHEFLDTVEQLSGAGAVYPSGGPYPAINNSGFVSNYATTTSEGPVPPSQDIGDVMACFATPTQLPVMYQLATQFALCDQWYSSIPGPTWPNRFFIHGASSSGLDHSPSSAQMGEWELPGEGFQYVNGSIYQALGNAGIPYRLYNDSGPGYLSLYSDDPQNGSAAGAVPQVSSLSGVTLLDINSLQHFASDLQGPYPYPYTFIEPHYGDIVSGTYAGGSSQHPMDDVYGGEHLLAAVYSAIRNSPYWNTSLLIITYDEHGGLYDSVAPGAATAPGDNPPYGYTQYGFNFEQYGLRVPAVVVSPLIAAGTVDHTVYDHASALKTVEEIFGLPALTQRDAAANSVMGLLTLDTPRTDCPTALNSPAPLIKAATPPMTAEEQAARDGLPVPRSGNLVGALQVLRKAEIEMSGGTPAEVAAAHARYDAIQTRGQARQYVDSVMARVTAARQQKKIAERTRP
ncbi:MAG TPA: alkaline phosphatase family protein [Longimicrobium sp.]|jgi:phospholipase C|uniref:alkaline phosphatase family protein n=1 Tax=Longimicrobium sp. TaxID=2029185 RepID=UPI002EDACFE3